MELPWKFLFLKGVIIYVHSVCLVPVEARREHGLSGPGVTGGCELANGHSELNPLEGGLFNC